MTEQESAKEMVEQTNANMTHDDVRNIFDVDIEVIETNATDGWYDVWLDDGSQYRVCAICGETQPMNITAMVYEDRSVVRDAMIQELKRGRSSLESVIERGFDESVLNERVGGWNNSTCEQRHPPLRGVDDE